MPFAPGLLAGKRALVTGGGTGLGKSIGRRFVELGAQLTICGRREAVLLATAEEFRKELGAEVAAQVCDVREVAAVETMLARVFAAGPLDILVNNAAGNFIAQSHRLSPRALDSVLNIVLHGTAYCTFGTGRRWIELGRPGVVLNILTLSALYGAAFTVPSAMAKAGVLAMTRSLAVEWGPKGIRVVAVAPGPFPTEGAMSRLYPKERQVRPLEQDIPLRRVGRHQELADLCAFLVSDHASFITGEAVVIDGAKSLQGVYGSGITAMQEWSDADWDKLKPKK